MAKKVSAEQMDMLFTFIRQHYVEYYDLQCELADHLANAIEMQWTTKPEMDFKDALNREFKKFGIFGFMDVVEKRQLALTKKYHKLMWGYFKEFFKLPKIILTLFVVFLVFKVVEYSVAIYTGLMISITVLGAYKLIAMYYDYRKKIKRTEKKWLFEDIIKRGGGIAATVYMPYYLIFHDISDNPSTVGMIYTAVLLTAFSLYLYIILYVIPGKANEHLLKTYPEYKM